MENFYRLISFAISIFICIGKSSHCHVAKPEGRSRPWISKMFAEAEMRFTIHSTASHQCRNDFDLYKLHLKNNSIWAIRMSESSEWPKLGLFVGRAPFLGHFDECVAIDSYNINGQHCMIESRFTFDEYADERPKHLLDVPSEKSSAWAAFQMYKYDMARMDRNRILWTLCVPSSCSSIDINRSLNHTLENIFSKYSVNIETKVKPEWCHKNEVILSTEYHCVKYFIGVLIVIVILSSFYNTMVTNNCKDAHICSKIIMCFAIQNNYRNLTYVNQGREDNLMHVCKVVGTIYLLTFHRIGYMIGHLHYDADAIEKMTSVLNHIVFFAPEMVDLMYFFSGVLMYQNVIKSSENDTITIVMKIFKRWLRLFTSYTIIRLFYAHVLPFLNNGPLWHEMQDEAARCRINLFGVLLTLPSARNEQICLLPSWQIGVDFQLSCIGYLCLNLIKRGKINSTKVFSYLMIVSFVLTFSSIFYYQYEAMPLISMKVFTISRQKENVLFHSTYMSVCSRLGPYILGAFVISIASKLRKEKFVFLETHQIQGFMAAICIKCLMSFYGVYLFTLSTYSSIGHAFYGAVYHALVNLPIIYIFLVHFVNGLEYLVTRIPRIVVSLGRLTYSFSLSHFMVILYHIFSQRTLSSYTDAFSVIHFIMADIALSYILAFLVYLVIEGPVQNIIHLGTPKHTYLKTELEVPNDNDRLLRKNE